MTEGEAFVYAGGGVGVYGEVGVPEAAVKENKWTRIVITLGAAPVTSSTSTSAGTGIGTGAASAMSVGSHHYSPFPPPLPPHFPGSSVSSSSSSLHYTGFGSGGRGGRGGNRLQWVWRNENGWR